MEASKDYDVIRYSPEYRDGVLTLQGRLWKADRDAISRYFRWKHEKNPYSDRPLVYLALRGDQVVGMRGFWRGEWRSSPSGRALPVVTAGDTVVHAAHESRGIFRRLMRFAMEDLRRIGIEYMVNLSASPATYLRSVRDGWVPIQPLRTFRTETGIWATVDRIHVRLSKTPGLWRLKDSDVLHRLAGFERRLLKQTSHVKVSHTARLADMERLVESQRTDSRITQLRNAKFLKWRFADPFASFRFLYWDDGSLGGFLVLHQKRRLSFGQITIADWQAEHAEILNALLDGALRISRSSAISIWTGSRSDSEIRILRGAGFQRFDDSRGKRWYSPSLLVRSANPDHSIAESDLADGGNWNIRNIFAD